MPEFTQNDRLFPFSAFLLWVGNQKLQESIMQQAQDFLLENTALAEILLDQPGTVFDLPTLFKAWTVNDVIGHLHMFNVAARLTLKSGEQFDAFFAPVAQVMSRGGSMLDAQYEWLGGLSGRALLYAWKEEWQTTANLYSRADPKQRVKWAGPDMSARSSITARQMETWAHGHEVFDCLGLVRTETDRIRNIAHLGVSTFGWSFVNRRQAIPEPTPHVVLTAPSGADWEWNSPQDDNRIIGSAVEFCQVVTQTRNVADTRLAAVGDTARRWLSIAQCFAGNPVDPPLPGLRHVAR
jgi:uncharacterized protein (TIGR03084 family)